MIHVAQAASLFPIGMSIVGGLNAAGILLVQWAGWQPALHERLRGRDNG